MTKPLFSVIMPTFNSEQFVAGAIESVLRQSLNSWELLIVDDCSSDGTANILREYAASDPRVRYSLSDKNLGAARTRNKAIEASIGRYIAFLDSDDEWRDNKLERQLEVFEASKTALAYSAYEKINVAGDRVGRVVTVPERIDYKGLLGATVIATVTAAYDTTRVGRVLMPDIRKRQDLALWLKILRTGGEACATNEPLAYLRKRPDSLSSNKLSAASFVWRVYRDLEGLSLGASSYYFSKYALRAFWKSLK